MPYIVLDVTVPLSLHFICGYVVRHLLWLHRASIFIICF